MALLKKTLFDEKLETYNVLVEDTAPFSDYFKITELPDVFSGGKNAFLIQGSPELVADSLIKIQIKDSQGNIIYHEPGEGIPEYYEGTSKVIAVYIYPDTSFGPCTITILGELKEYYSNRILNPVPLNWEGTYNVRWQKQVNVNPLLQNTSKIRFYRRPKVNIEETILPIYNRSVNRVTISGSVDGIAVNPIVNTNFRTFKGDTLYELKISGSNFSSSMEGETITITDLNQSYSTTIKDVVTSNKAYATLPYYETSSATSPQFVKEFSSASFELAYNESVTLTNSSISSSFAKIKLTDLEAFSGDVNRLKIYASRKADIGNYTLLEDIQLESTELLQTDEYSGSVSVRTGQFTSTKLLNDFWRYRNYNTSVDLPIIVDNTTLASSVKLEDLGVLNTTLHAQRIFEYWYPLSFTKDTEYQLDFTPLLASSNFTNALIEVYAVGGAFIPSDLDNDGDLEDGKMLFKLETTNGFQKYDRQQINFKADSTGYGTIIFAVYQGNWHLSNISLRAAEESSFSPSEISLNVAVPTKVKNDTFDFKFEFYDINNNYVPVNLNQEFTFTGGNDLVVRKSITVTPDGNLFSFSGSGESIGVSSINFDIAKVGLTGSTIFYSSAFDENGDYIQPSVYGSQPFYPGLLTNVTSGSATLTVSNFTGSLTTPKVTRILYTASCEDVRDLVNIYRVDQGANGQDGREGSDGTTFILIANKNQFVYDPDNHFEPAQSNDFIDIKLSSNIVSGSLTITSGSFLPKLQKLSTTQVGFYTESVYRIYSGNDEEDVAMLGTNAASWSYYTPTNLIHGGTYLFTQNGFSSSVQLEGVLKGDKSKNLNATSNANQFFYKMTDVSLSPSGQSITIDVKRNNLGSTTNAITVTSGSGKPVLTVGSNNGTTGVQSYSINGSNYPYSAGATTYTFFAEDLNFDGYTDTITITPVIAESQIAVNVSNENTTFPAYSGGSVFGGFLASSGSISVKVGSEDITYASTIANNRFSASISSSTNVTGVLTNNNYSITALSADSGSLNLKVTYRDGRGSDSTFTKLVTYSKAKAGAPNVLVAVSPSAQSIAANSRTSGSATPASVTVTALEAGTSRFTSIGTPVYTNGLAGDVSSNTITFTSTASSIAGSTAQVTIPVNYTDSEGVTGTKNVVATVSKALASAPSTIVSIEKDGQTITRSKTGTYGTPSSFRINVLEGANSSSYDNTAPFASSTFRITSVTSGSVNATDLDKYATITPTTPSSTSGVVVSITGSYVDSEGTTTSFFKTHNVNVATDGSDGATGASGPGIVFRGPWSSTITYFDTDDSPGRRDAVLYSGTYYATKTNATTNLNKQPNVETTFWESLGTDSFFVAAKIIISENSFVEKTLNVGTNTSGNANITIQGGTTSPYISVGQSSQGSLQTFGANGIYLGVTGSAQNTVVSFVSGSSYFKFNTAAASDSIIEIGGKITSTAGSIGGWSLDNGTLTGGSVILDAVNGRITAGGVNGVVISGSLGIVAGTPAGGVRPFSVGLNGLLYASNATISGSIFATTITANSGLIGGWNIDGSGMYKYNTSGDTVVRLDSAGSQISVAGPSSTVQIKDKLTTNFSGAGGHGSTGASSWVTVNSSGDAASSIAGTTLYAGMAASGGSISLGTSAQTFSSLAANTTYNLTLKLKFRFKLESGYENGSRVQTLVHSLNTQNDYYALRDYDYDPFSYGTPIGEQLWNDWQYQIGTPYRWVLEAGGGYENSQGDIASGVKDAYDDLLANYVGDTTTTDYRNFISGIVKPNFTITKNGFSATSFVEKSVVYGVDTLSAINPTYDTSTFVPNIPTIGTNARLRPITNTDYIETNEFTLTSAISVPATGFNNGFAINVSNIFNSVGDYYSESAWATAAYNSAGEPFRSVRWDTLIETDSGTKMAKDVLETDLLKIWDSENNKFIFRPYSFKYNRLYKNYYFVKIDENELYVSSNHNFWLENGEQINVKDLVEGITELFVKYDNIVVPKIVEVVSEIQSDGDEFITFTIEQYENYLSNNIISHNIAPVGGGGTTVNFIYAIGSNNSFPCKVKNIEMQVTSITMSAVSKFVEVTATGIQAVFDSNQTVNAFSIKGFDSGGTAIVPSTSAFNINSAGYWKHTGEIHSTGDIVGFTTAGASDERLKDNIQNVTEEDYLKLKELVPVTYSWISDEEKHKHYGLIAQQVEKIFPELTRKKVFGQYMTINYIGLIPILVGMIQNQNERIKNLENKLNGSN